MLHEKASYGLSYIINATVEGTPIAIHIFGYFILSLATRDEDYTPRGEPSPRGFDDSLRYSLSLILGQPPAEPMPEADIHPCICNCNQTKAERLKLSGNMICIDMPEAEPTL
jgi:hypothetical protein